MSDNELVPLGGAAALIVRLVLKRRPSAPAELSQPGLVFSNSEVLRRPPTSETIAALVDAFSAERVSGQARELDFTPSGGAYNRTRPEATAFVQPGERFLLKHAVALDYGANYGRLTRIKAGYDPDNVFRFHRSLPPTRS